MSEPIQLSLFEEKLEIAPPPSESGGQVQCVRCGELLAAGEGYFCINGFPYCEFCIDGLGVEELVRICEIPKRKWLEQMGFTFKRVDK